MRGYRMKISATSWKDIVIAELKKKDDAICPLCDLPLANELIEVDHIIPKAVGGLDEMSNLRLVHLTCHRVRHFTNPRKGDALETLIDLRKRADLIMVRRFKKALILTEKIGLAIKRCGITYDQSHYLRKKYKLGKDPLTWDV